MSSAVIIENFSFPTTTPSVCFFVIFSSKSITYTLNRIGLIGHLLILPLSRTFLIFYSSPSLCFLFLYMFPLFFFSAVLLFFSASLLIFLCVHFVKHSRYLLYLFVFFFLFIFLVHYPSLSSVF